MTDEAHATHSANEHMPPLLFSGAATRIQGSSRRGREMAPVSKMIINDLC